MRSLTQAAEAHSRKLGKKLFCYALPLFLLITSGFLAYSRMRLLDQSLESIRGQLSHAISVGDGFQIQRLLGGEVRTGSLVSARLLVSDSQMTEFSAGSERFQKPLELSGKSIIISKSFMIETANGQLGNATLSSSVPLSYILLIILIVLIVSVLFSYLLNIALTSFAKELTDPIRGLAAAVSDEFSCETSGIYEIGEVFQQIRQAKEIERANQFLIENTKKSEALISLSSRVAHDIRSPLSAIKVGVKLLGRNPSVEALELVESAVKRIDAIAEDLLRSSRRENEVFNLSEVLEDLVETFSMQTGLSIGFHGDSEIQISGPKVSVARAFANLIQNGIEACADKAGSVSVTGNVVGARAIIEIHDTGKGMPPNVVTDLGRVSGMSFNKLNGNGLGFHSAQSVLKALGGDIRVTSELSVGTKVNISLPILAVAGKKSTLQFEVSSS